MFKQYILPPLLLVAGLTLLSFKPINIIPESAPLISSREIQNNFIQYKEFDQRNQISVILTNTQGDIFNPTFFKTLKDLAEEIFYLPGVDRTNILSLFTNNLSFREVIEDGFAGKMIIPENFSNSQAEFDAVKNNLSKSLYVGKLVSYDYRSALISVPFYRAEQGLELTRRIEQLLPSSGNIQSSLLGMTPFMIEIKKQLSHSMFALIFSWFISVILFSLITRKASSIFCLIIAPLLTITLQCVPFGIFNFPIHPYVFPVIITTFILSFTDIAWITLNTTKIDTRVPIWLTLLPTMSLCFLGSDWAYQILYLAISGTVSLFIVRYFFLNSIPTTLKGFKISIISSGFKLSRVIRKIIMLSLLIAGLTLASKIVIGNLGAGSSMLRNDSPYLEKQLSMTKNFAFALDSILVLAISPEKGCTDPATVSVAEEFHWSLSNIPGVRTIWSLGNTVKKINAFYHENYLKWITVPREKATLIASTSVLDSRSGLLDQSGLIFPITIFLENHNPQVLTQIYEGIKSFESPDNLLSFKIVGGTAGTEAIINEMIKASWKIILLILLLTFLVITRFFFHAHTTINLCFLYITILSLTLGLSVVLGINLYIDTIAALVLSSCVCFYFLWTLQNMIASRKKLSHILLLLCVLISGGLFSQVNFIFRTAGIAECMLIITWLVGFNLFPVKEDLRARHAKT
ncbi:MAG: hypothetical protein H6754_06495 [Candidatus Omnitrophica bacterium]|nr:hypothetical protein [Candidatus Omnitrophota bacterium]